MRRLISTVGATMILLSASAQQNINMPVPEKRPTVTGDRSVIFSLTAPEATEVRLAGSLASLPNASSRDAEGRWIFTFEDVAPDLYDYWFEVDGVKTLDPSNPYVARDIASLANIFIVPGGEADFFMSQDVPHGKVEKTWYNSDKLGGNRRITIYTPAGYDSSEVEYPVLYLLHGMGGDEDAWQELGRAVEILDNMIAVGSVEPMIVVMPNGNAMRKAAPGFTSDGMYIAEGHHSADPERNFEKAFSEITDFVEANYRVKADKGSRAIAGLSMGGGHAWRISMMQPDDFDYIGLFSPAVRWNGNGVDANAADPELDNALNRQFETAPKLYMIAIGKDDFLYDINRDYRNLLDSKGFEYEYVESDGGHTWTNWRHYLVNFLPRLFK